MVRVLIVENERDVAEVVARYLRANGYDAEYLLDPRKSFTAAKGFDLILIDLMMPVMPGPEFLAEMRKRKITVPTLMMTAADLSPEARKKLSKACDGNNVVEKTRILEDLIPAIENALSARKVR